jgi:hypothetical protein
VAALLLGLVADAHGHHLGVYVPKDDEVTASFKRMKIFLEGQRADLLRMEFSGDGSLRRRMAEVDARYNATLTRDMERALYAESILAVERILVRFFCFVSREKVQEALDRLADGRPDPEGERRGFVAALLDLLGLGPPTFSVQQKADQAVKLLAAAWRYYNLIDFRVGQMAPHIATAAKVTFEDGEYYLGKSAKGWEAFDEAKAREALTRFRDLMTGFLDTSPLEPGSTRGASSR